jgi:hypothetical protein
MPPLETLSYIGVMAVTLFLLWKIYNKVTDKHKEDCDKITKECSNIKNRLTVVETKQDIYLHELGFDIPDMNSKINAEMAKLGGTEGLSVGCIDVGKLKRRRIRRKKP